MGNVTKILFLSADPADAARLRLGEEIREVRERLRLSNFRDQFELVERHCVRPVDLTQAIFDTEPDIVHFSGHGSATGAVFFEDEHGAAFPVSPEALEAVFKLFSAKIFCVVLNACYSRHQAEAIARNIQYVVGMQDRIGDAAAINFAVGFYKAVINQRGIEDAFQFGLAEMRLSGTPEHATPVLVPNPRLRPPIIVKGHDERHWRPEMPGRVRVTVPHPSKRMIDDIYALIDPAAYSSVSGVLDDLYMNTLRDRFPPYTYGEKWILVSYLRTEQAMVPLTWIASDMRPVTTVYPEWGESTLASQMLDPDSDWFVHELTDSDKFWGVVTNNQGVIDAINEDGTKALYLIERELAAIPASEVTDEMLARHRYVRVFWNPLNHGPGNVVLIDHPGSATR